MNCGDVSGQEKHCRCSDIQAKQVLAAEIQPIGCCTNNANYHSTPETSESCLAGNKICCLLAWD